MNFRITLCLAVCGMSVALWATRARSQENKAAAPEQKQPSAVDMQKMMDGMKKWMATVNPGTNHEKLEVFVGQWETVTRMWMAGPSAPPIETKGKSDVKWVLGKRFLLEEHKGEMLMPDPTGALKPVPYEGLGQWGYDNIRNLFVGTWASTAGTNLQMVTGSVDPSGKHFRLFGEMDEPMLDVYGRLIKFEIKVIDNDKHVFTIYDLHAADDYKAAEITYTRKK